MKSEKETSEIVRNLRGGFWNYPLVFLKVLRLLWTSRRIQQNDIQYCVIEIGLGLLSVHLNFLNGNHHQANIGSTISKSWSTGQILKNLKDRKSWIFRDTSKSLNSDYRLRGNSSKHRNAHFFFFWNILYIFFFRKR